jgi:zinc finger CCHC domain-containing protein 9
MMSTICFACRERGHAAKDCPTNPSNGRRSQAGMGICYRCGLKHTYKKFLYLTIVFSSRCGSSQHTLSKCRKPADKANSLPFASCFVCKGTGHLVSACPQNDKGVYPNGGCCKLCSKTDHLARNCPLRSKAARAFL